MLNVAMAKILGGSLPGKIAQCQVNNKLKLFSRNNGKGL
ncbi:hypothetical protein AVDCRST_MAG84-5335 [uncultured Microcoleus sp.]|uniref:Uncharacterized protein n=1 Tax=uncultured Microcoleus sp. TaxID=259945 RepID=A0A6J4KPW4_9CYAN|nr:hypothetical protein AVDCRST_MAG84-839 [uncultured Microcoleus sp.]CAA9385916.1 hypothetical protein AVDCRST_MAG84-5335 [uncultured Microcoleus sp.]